MSEVDFALFFNKLIGQIAKDPLKYFVKSPKMINFTPTPAQTVALKSIFGQELDATTEFEVFKENSDEHAAFNLEKIKMSEVELYEYMTGFGYSKKDIKERNRINLIVGRRGGKSTVAAIVALYSAIKINWKPYLKKTPVATVAILSHSVDFSQEILDILKLMVDESEVLNALRDDTRKNTQSTFHLKVPFLVKDKEGKTLIEYSAVAIKVGAASKKTTRGRAVCTLLCDEIAYWNLDENSYESDIDVLRAIRPALLQFGDQGTVIKLSSPGIKQGVLYDEWNKRKDIKKTYVQFKAPSWVWNTILPADNFYDEWKLDPDGFDTEYRANFVDSISNFILPEYVDMCVLKGIQFLPPSENKKVVYTAAIDAAFKNDRFAFALVGHYENKIKTHVIKYWEGSRNEPVKAFEVAKFIHNICSEFGINNVMADQHSFQPLREIFEKFGINLVENTFSLPYKRKIYFGLKRLIHNKNIDLLDIPLVSKELKELQVEQTPTGQIRIGHPMGGSDDLSDAVAVATFSALKKAGSMGMAFAEVASAVDSRIKTDMTGKAFVAPSIDMLHSYKGFANAMDNSHEYKYDPETKKYIKIEEIEENGIPGSEGPDFSF